MGHPLRPVDVILRVFQQDLDNHRTRSVSSDKPFIRDSPRGPRSISVSMPRGGFPWTPVRYGFNHRTVKHSICFCRNFTWFWQLYFLDKQHCTFDSDHGVQVPNPALQPLSPTSALCCWIHMKSCPYPLSIVLNVKNFKCMDWKNVSSYRHEKNWPVSPIIKTKENKTVNVFISHVKLGKY